MAVSDLMLAILAMAADSRGLPYADLPEPSFGKCTQRAAMAAGPIYNAESEPRERDIIYGRIQS
jgi:hypothetical protein